jgi:hypothetical protein
MYLYLGVVHIRAKGVTIGYDPKRLHLRLTGSQHHLVQASGLLSPLGFGENGMYREKEFTTRPDARRRRWRCDEDQTCKVMIEHDTGRLRKRGNKCACDVFPVCGSALVLSSWAGATNGIGA